MRWALLYLGVLYCVTCFIGFFCTTILRQLSAFGSNLGQLRRPISGKILHCLLHFMDRFGPSVGYCGLPYPKNAKSTYMNHQHHQLGGNATDHFSGIRGWKLRNGNMGARDMTGAYLRVWSYHGDVSVTLHSRCLVGNVGGWV